MYQVTTFHLGPDGRRASASSESSDRGELSAEELVVLLDAFTELAASFRMPASARAGSGSFHTAPRTAAPSNPISSQRASLWSVIPPIARMRAGLWAVD